MRKRRACHVVARRLGLNVNRVAALVQRATEAGLLPVATGSARPDLTNLELARLLLAAVCDNGLGNVPTTVRAFDRLETEGGLQFCDWLESLVAGRIDTDAIRGIVLQVEPEPGATVITESSRLHFGPASASAARAVSITGDVLRSITEDFQNGLG
ncbi:hypothetical protein [Bradyrhizobium manausense]|uniref:HTH merR-type domain-containing protein n=1 Tax=Bradyrhizobium manausense TaxID=989370 RepID=A0A0R3D818_9BRAD|nr:hypothetical protein [Bradyrhizobium manausense]KRQ03506.1 hypothetical protein AOQ71_32920 [Bradyrhizobium manausense]